MKIWLIELNNYIIKRLGLNLDLLSQQLIKSIQTVVIFFDRSRSDYTSTSVLFAKDIWLHSVDNSSTRRLQLLSKQSIFGVFLSAASSTWRRTACWSTAFRIKSKMTISRAISAVGAIDWCSWKRKASIDWMRIRLIDTITINSVGVSKYITGIATGSLKYPFNKWIDIYY